MKCKNSTKRFLSVAFIFYVLFVAQGFAQFSIGPKIGFANTGVSFGKLLKTKESTIGFTGGVTAEYMFYKSKLGLDLSLLYTHRGEKSDLYISEEESTSYDLKNSRNYLDIPVNFKWKILDNYALSPYVFTGPQVSFRLSKQQPNKWIRNKAAVFYWNFGLGLEVIKSFQIAFSYGLGITNSVDYYGITGKDWNLALTAAYLFNFE